MAYESRGDYGPDGDRGYGRTRGRRPVTDCGATMVHWMQTRMPRCRGGSWAERERPSASYIVDMLPPLARVTQAADSIPSKHLHSSLNKIKHPVNMVRWTPEGRRLLTASSSGEFTLWNGTGFNFETIMQAHDVAIRAMVYAHNDDWLISADQDGAVKYWQPNFNNVKVIQAHNDPIRDLAFSPSDAKFLTASDDSTLKIFDFAAGAAEATLQGHGWDAKSCDWHPTKGLLVSGSKDHLVKLWDPRSGRCLSTLHGHKNTITKTLFERVRGNCLATSARDQTARVMDLRMLRDTCLLKGHEKDISTLMWHPIHPNLISTAGSDGSLFHYLLDEPHTPSGQPTSLSPYDSSDPSSAPPLAIYPAHKVPYAHDFAIWSLDWHPLGHILASGSNDRITRFWSRARPGETDFMQDRYHIGEAQAEAQGTWHRRDGRRQRQEEEEQEMEDEMEGLVDQKMPIKAPHATGLPGLPGLSLPSHGIIPLPLPPPLPAVSGNQNTGLPPPPPLPFPVPPPGIDPNNPADFAKIAEMMQKAGVPLPPPPGMFPPGLIPPPSGVNFPLPPGFPVPGAEGESSGAGNMRRRAPLPSQEESLRAEQRRGNYTRVR